MKIKLLWAGADPSEHFDAVPRPSAALVGVSGVMTPSVTRAFATELRRLEAESDKSRVIVYMNTPGGSVDQVPAAGEAMRRLSLKRDTLVYTDSLLCSAGYWVASQARAILAAPLALVGSIGTVSVVVDDSEFFGRMGFKIHQLVSGPLKSPGGVGQPVTEADLAYYQGFVDRYSSEFYKVVQAGRSLSDERMDPLKSGAVWFADEAKAYGLVDRVESLSDFLDREQIKAATSAARAVAGEPVVHTTK